MRDWDLVKVFAFDYNDLCLSTVFKGSRAVWSRHDGGHGWQGWGRRDTRDFGETDLKTAKKKKKPKRSQMTSFDLIQFSITVSSNHRERRERMKGRQRR